MIGHFFEFLVRKREVNLLIYAKMTENARRAIGRHYETVAMYNDATWGRSYIVVKMVWAG